MNFVVSTVNKRGINLNRARDPAIQNAGIWMCQTNMEGAEISSSLKTMAASMPLYISGCTLYARKLDASR